MSDYEKIRKIIEESDSVVFFGGAGVSTPSGIPDFRGGGGLYSEKEFFGYRPEELLHRNMLEYYPDLFYKYYRNHMLYPNAEPNGAHRALAELERRGKLSLVVTQNIDGLHQLAGSKNVAELHGSTLRNYCTSCRRKYGLARILEDDGVPLCSCGGFIRPDVVMYGEGLPIDEFMRAESAISSADTLIVGGTSLTVNPAASLVDSFLGEHLIIINYSETPRDDYAEYIIRDSIDTALEKIVYGE